MLNVSGPNPELDFQSGGHPPQRLPGDCFPVGSPFGQRFCPLVSDFHATCFPRDVDPLRWLHEYFT